jgi:hypothetical protein
MSCQPSRHNTPAFPTRNHVPSPKLPRMGGNDFLAGAETISSHGRKRFPRRGGNDFLAGAETISSQGRKRFPRRGGNDFLAWAETISSQGRKRFPRRGGNDFLVYGAPPPTPSLVPEGSGTEKFRPYRYGRNEVSPLRYPPVGRTDRKAALRSKGRERRGGGNTRRQGISSRPETFRSREKPFTRTAMRFSPDRTARYRRLTPSVLRKKQALQPEILFRNERRRQIIFIFFPIFAA